MHEEVRREATRAIDSVGVAKLVMGGWRQQLDTTMRH